MFQQLPVEMQMMILANWQDAYQYCKADRRFLSTYNLNSKPSPYYLTIDLAIPFENYSSDDSDSDGITANDIESTIDTSTLFKLPREVGEDFLYNVFNIHPLVEDFEPSPFFYPFSGDNYLNVPLSYANQVLDNLTVTIRYSEQPYSTILEQHPVRKLEYLVNEQLISVKEIDSNKPFRHSEANSQNLFPIILADLRESKRNPDSEQAHYINNLKSGLVKPESIWDKYFLAFELDDELDGYQMDVGMDLVFSPTSLRSYWRFTYLIHDVEITSYRSLEGEPEDYEDDDPEIEPPEKDLVVMSQYFWSHGPWQVYAY